MAGALAGTTIVAGAVALGPWPAGNPASSTPRWSVTELVGGAEDAGFQRADRVRPFTFPRDHGAHPDYRSEWWYFTGNLGAPADRRFGFQLTFFRFALRPPGDTGTSAWRTTQAYMAHFALTDVSGRRFYAFERFNRGALGLAGAETEPLRLWLDHWTGTGSPIGSDCAGCLALQLTASEGDIALDLRLRSRKPAVLHGDRGLSAKSGTPGNASYYYSLTRLESDGEIKVGDQRFPVTGWSWLDREWSTSALDTSQRGWDWFALQLSDGRDIMLYRIRRDDGGTDPHSGGTLVKQDGDAAPLRYDAVTLEATRYWRSPHGVRYPDRWRLRIPAHALDLEVETLLPEQELDLSVRYWEGAVRITGRSGTAAVQGYGYVELVGYDGR